MTPIFRWKAGPDSERELWQGLAQLCVGITHAERGNRVGALRLVGRARRRLETYAATDGPAYGLDLDQIIEWIRNRESEPDASSWLRISRYRAGRLCGRASRCGVRAHMCPELVEGPAGPARALRSGGVRCGLVATRDMGSSQLPALRRWFGCAITVIMLIELGACAGADQSPSVAAGKADSSPTWFRGRERLENSASGRA